MAKEKKIKLNGKAANDNFEDKTAEQCLSYLFDLRWPNGSTHKCPKCNGELKKNKAYHMQCTKCNSIFSPTSGTLFHHAKFKLPVMLSIVHAHVVTAPAFEAKTSEKYPHYQIAKKLNLLYPNVFSFRKKKLSKIKLKPGMTMDEYVTLALKHKKIEPTYVRALEKVK